MQAAVDDCYGHISTVNERINFGNNVRADIETNEQLATINEELPIAMQGLLTSAEEVGEIIRRAPNKRSTGGDQMPYVLIKRFAPSVLLLLTIFFNHLVAKAYFPRIWRHSTVTPIPKSGKDQSIIVNWRPICLRESSP